MGIMFFVVAGGSSENASEKGSLSFSFLQTRPGTADAATPLLHLRGGSADEAHPAATPATLAAAGAISGQSRDPVNDVEADADSTAAAPLPPDALPATAAAAAAVLAQRQRTRQPKHRRRWRQLPQPPLSPHLCGRRLLLLPVYAQGSRAPLSGAGVAGNRLCRGREGGAATIPPTATAGPAEAEPIPQLETAAATVGEEIYKGNR